MGDSTSGMIEDPVALGPELVAPLAVPAIALHPGCAHWYQVLRPVVLHSSSAQLSSAQPRAVHALELHAAMGLPSCARIDVHVLER